MFDTTKADLKDILRKVDEGRLQLPDFQRDYVWGDADVVSLIASIGKGFPVGALLTLETGGEVEFVPRPVVGVEINGVAPDELLLDGQQRMTSLYQSLYSDKPVRTRTDRGTEVERHYYLDIKKALGSAEDLEEAIVGVPGDKVIRHHFGKRVQLDLTEREAEFENDLFPLYEVFDSHDWLYDWRDYWKSRDRDVSDIDKKLFRSVIEAIERYKMPIICLDRSNSREAICLVFEKVNVGGKKLDAFELVTAIYAAKSFDLRQDWGGPESKGVEGRYGRIQSGQSKKNVLARIANTDFLQACAILHSRENRLAKEAQGLEGKELPQISCKRDALLALPLEAYQKHADAIEKGFIEAGAFLNELKIIWRRDVPYPPATTALASVFAILGRDAQTAAAKKKIAQWYWSITLGELYGSSTESRLARDVPELVNWIKDDEDRPRSLEEAIFQQDRLRSLRSRLSAAYKGIHALLMRGGCRDFISGRPTDIMTFFNDRIDIHHVFPQAWCKRNGIPPKVFNSIINKTPLSKQSNIAIGGDAPSIYLARIEKKHGITTDDLDEILRTHLIEPEYLRNDDFEGYFNARMEALTTLVGDAMSKTVVTERGADEVEIDVDDAEADSDDEFDEDESQ